MFRLVMNQLAVMYIMRGLLIPAAVGLSELLELSPETIFMRRSLKRPLLLLVISLATLSSALSQTPKVGPQDRAAKRESNKPATKRDAHGPNVEAPRPNLATEPTLYIVGYAHLDTEWRWEYPQVIQEYLTKRSEE